ncbi:MAG: type II toxin-antitoxin system VapC family toxin [Ornithinimicrobium sp.]
MIVLDASAWVDVLCGVVAPPSPDQAVVVPPHFDAEVIGALRALSQRQVLTDDQADRAVDQHLRADFTTDRDPEDARRAWRWRESMSLPDAWYAALASRLDVAWVTTDQRAATTARGFGVAVADLG